MRILKTILFLLYFYPFIVFSQEGNRQFMPNLSDRLWLEIHRSDDNLFAMQSATDKEFLSLYVYPGGISESNNVSCPFKSIIMFKNDSNIDGFAPVLLNLDRNGYSTSGNDKALQLELKIGTNYVLCDFTKDNWPEVADGSYTATATFLGRRPAHFSLYDVELLSGISTYTIRPFNKMVLTLCWYDTQIGS